MEEYRDCVIVYKTGKGVCLRSTKLTVQNTDKLAVVWDNDNVMAIVPFAEIKTILFCETPDAEKLLEYLCND